LVHGQTVIPVLFIDCELHSNSSKCRGDPYLRLQMP